MVTRSSLLRKDNQALDKQWTTKWRSSCCGTLEPRLSNWAIPWVNGASWIITICLGVRIQKHSTAWIQICKNDLSIIVASWIAFGCIYAILQSHPLLRQVLTSRLQFVRSGKHLSSRKKNKPIISEHPQVDPGTASSFHKILLERWTCVYILLRYPSWCCIYLLKEKRKKCGH